VTDLIRTFRQPATNDNRSITLSPVPRSFVFQNAFWELERRCRDFSCGHAELCDFTLLL